MPTYMGKSIELPPGTLAIPMRCTDCGAEIRLLAPVGINDLAAIARAFEDEHVECVLDRKEKEQK